jgi:hypothetical protein
MGATPPRRRQVKANAKHSSAGCAAPTLRYGRFAMNASQRRGSPPYENEPPRNRAVFLDASAGAPYMPGSGAAPWGALAAG